MRNPLTGIAARLRRLLRPAEAGPRFIDFGDVHEADSSQRRIPVRLAVAVAVVVLLLLVLVVSSLDSSPGNHPVPAAGQGNSNQPWWAGDAIPGTPRPSLTTPPSSDTYLIVGPEAKSPSATPSTSRAPGKPGGGPVAKPPPKGPIGATFSAVSGDGCPHDSTRGYQEIGRYTDGSRGWYSRTNGGWTGNGCRGWFDALPMSGSATSDDPSAFVVWWFKPTNMQQGTCAISVFIPTGNAFEDVAGKPAYYNVVAGQRNYQRVAGFRIDQIPARGSWVSAGSYPLRDGQIAVQMVTRGEDPNGEHLAAAQVKVACRSS
jgi:hypothetical protein